MGLWGLDGVHFLSKCVWLAREKSLKFSITAGNWTRASERTVRRINSPTEPSWLYCKKLLVTKSPLFSQINTKMFSMSRRHLLAHLHTYLPGNLVLVRMVGWKWHAFPLHDNAWYLERCIMASWVTTGNKRRGKITSHLLVFQVTWWPQKLWIASWTRLGTTALSHLISSHSANKSSARQNSPAASSLTAAHRLSHSSALSNLFWLPRQPPYEKGRHLPMAES